MTMIEVLNLVGDHAEAIIAGCALLLTVYEGRLTRKHNRLTVVPRLVAKTDFHTMAAPVAFQMTATLVNAGIGPAIIKSFSVLNGDKQHSVESFDDSRKVVEQIIGQPALSDWYFFVPLKGHAVKAGEEIVLAKFISVLQETRFSSREELYSALQKVGVLITYESIYGEIFTYDSRDHFK